MKKIIFLLLFIPLFALPQSSVTGFAINSNGYIATNHHFIYGDKNIMVTGIDGDMETTYHAKVIVEDQRNDLVILKIEKWLGEIPYKINKSTLGIGSPVYALGYPLISRSGIRDTSSIRGSYCKFTDGKITGGSIYNYYHSAPIHPGNRGGPLFNYDGDIIGINTFISEDVMKGSASVKVRHLMNLMEDKNIPFPSSRGLNNYDITQQIEKIKNFIYLIIDSNDSMTRYEMEMNPQNFPSWDCDGQGNCSDPGTGNGQYSSQSACQSSCIVPSWDCDGQGNCSDPGTGMGIYTSLTYCQSNCKPPPSWDCIGGFCKDLGTGKGQYTIQVECQSNCVITSTWDCDGQGNCNDPGTGQGQYTTHSKCKSNCYNPVKINSTKTKEERRNSNRNPMQVGTHIGLISNASQSPFGINLLIMQNSNVGIYLAARSDLDIYSPGEWGLRDKDWIENDMGGISTGIYEDGGHDNYTVGASFGGAISETAVLIFYSGITWDTKKIFEEYEATWSGPYYTKSSTELKTAWNMGLMIQTDTGLSYQFGYDFYDFPIKLESMRGVNIHFGIGVHFGG